MASWPSPLCSLPDQSSTGSKLPYAEKLLRRYNKVHRLADAGMDGEKTLAREILGKLQAEYPGIAVEAESLRLADEGPPKPNESDQPANGNFGGTVDPRWQRWGQAAENAFGWASRVMEEATRANYAQQVAEQIVEIKERRLRSGKWQVSASVDDAQMDSIAATFNDAQKHAFANYIAGEVRAMVFQSLILEDEDDEPIHQSRSHR